jgi:hypothetical protein
MMMLMMIDFLDLALPVPTVSCLSVCLCGSDLVCAAAAGEE